MEWYTTASVNSCTCSKSLQEFWSHNSVCCLFTNGGKLTFRTFSWSHKSKILQHLTISVPFSTHFIADWLIVNKQMTALARFNYDNNNWDLITRQLHSNHSRIPTLNRVQVILDVMELSKYNVLKVRTPIRKFQSEINARTFWVLFSCFNTYLS